jgi:hypothetical protein
MRWFGLTTQNCDDRKKKYETEHPRKVLSAGHPKAPILPGADAVVQTVLLGYGQA